MILQIIFKPKNPEQQEIKNYDAGSGMIKTTGRKVQLIHVSDYYFDEEAKELYYYEINNPKKEGVLLSSEIIEQCAISEGPILHFRWLDPDFSKKVDEAREEAQKKPGPTFMTNTNRLHPSQFI